MTTETRFWFYFTAAGLVGVLLFGAGFIAAPGLMNALFNTMFFGSAASPFSADANAYNLFVYAVLGAIMIGWVISLGGLVWLAARGQTTAWWLFCASVLVWYAVDTTASLALGYPANAALNTLMLVLLGVPMVALFQHMRQQA
jgi:hypothetical protein